MTKTEGKQYSLLRLRRSRQLTLIKITLADFDDNDDMRSYSEIFKLLLQQNQMLIKIAEER